MCACNTAFFKQLTIRYTGVGGWVGRACWGQMSTPGVFFNEFPVSLLRWWLSGRLASQFMDSLVSSPPMVGLQVYHHTLVLRMSWDWTGALMLVRQALLVSSLSSHQWSPIVHIVITVHVLLSKVHLFSFFPACSFLTSLWQHCLLCCSILKTTKPCLA